MRRSSRAGAETRPYGGIGKGDVDSLLVIKALVDVGEEFSGVEGLVVCPDAVDGMEEFAHDGDEGLDGPQASLLELLVEGLEVGVPSHGDERRHVERCAQVFVSRGSRPDNLLYLEF